ncbi:polar amino acid transport system permease protein [Mesorhizobium soli]|uniref:amino acid ABC transporter permease n=1 Tax=Pseudaminobacter soli (ex Li et al. 2025) TaxID=1295366 RepID=UPI00247549EB|nr:amino acid ABC transporter permease [Mesorhizobium soli]MDH6233330.1 polar amino acid transport system permease protein [Mesorhizobium soli]
MRNVASASSTPFIIVPRRKTGTKILGVVVIVLLALLVRAFWVGDIAWSYVGDNFFAPSVVKGVVNSIIMTFCAMVLGIVLGVIAAIMRMSDNTVLRNVSVGYVWLFRGTPALLQLLLWFNLALIFPTIGIPGLFSFRTVDVMTPFVAALLGLGIQQGAYTAEVVRAGILSIDKGQTEAGLSIGMTPLRATLKIVLPQAMRVIVPPIGNETIGMVKLTSLASVIQYSELLRSVEDVYYVNSRVIELLIVAAIWYMVVVTVLSVGQIFVERHFSKGWGGHRPDQPAQQTLVEEAA